MVPAAQRYGYVQVRGNESSDQQGAIMSAVRKSLLTLRRVAMTTVLVSCLGLAFASSARAEQTWPEQEGHHGVNTFTDYHNASGEGTPIAPAAWVDVSCKVYDPTIASVNPDGYWYRIASSPWDDQYYAPANTFMNGDPWNGPFTHNTDFAVPDCDTLTPTTVTTTSTTNPTVILAQGPAAPAGYRYAITLSGFPSNASVSITCYDSVSTSGFYTFSLTTDGSGNAFTQSYCSSGDGPEHWVTADGVESNQVAWGGATTVTVTTTSTTNPTVGLAQGPAAPAGYRYAITLSGFPSNASVSITCYDSVSTSGFYTFSLTTDGSGNAFTQSYCSSGDGPEHWVTADGVESNQVAWGGATTVTVTTGTTPSTTSTSSPGSVPVNSFYYREQATDWALANAEDVQPSGDACTWFVSQALWAGGFPKSSTWTDAGSHWLSHVPPRKVSGTATAWTVGLLEVYLVNHFKPTIHLDFLGKLSTAPGALPRAVPGDIIIYSWHGNSTMDHMAFVVPTKQGQTATQVAAWTETRPGASSQPWSQRAWNWSAKDHEPITTEYPSVTAWLLHIDGGFWVSSY